MSVFGKVLPGGLTSVLQQMPPAPKRSEPAGWVELKKQHLLVADTIRCDYCDQFYSTVAPSTFKNKNKCWTFLFFTNSDLWGCGHDWSAVWVPLLQWHADHWQFVTGDHHTQIWILQASGCTFHGCLRVIAGKCAHCVHPCYTATHITTIHTLLLPYNYL